MKNSNMRIFYIALLGLILCLYLIFISLFLLESTDQAEIFSSIVEDITERNKEYPIVLWWVSFPHYLSSGYRKCGKEICFFTNQRKYFSDPLTRGLLFYGTLFEPTDLPLPRMPYHDWGLMHEESPKNNFLFLYEEVLSLFNHSTTFRRESDLPLTLQFLKSLEVLTSKTYFIPTEQKFSNKENLAPAVYVQSDCNPPSGRDDYVEELSKYIKVDSYGKCLQNKELPKSISNGVESMNAVEFWKILSSYKFSLAFENAVCQDYVTEKLWRPLILGSIPIYYGSPTIEDWLPNPESAILVKNFASPKLLAEHLLRLSNDSVAYNMHLEHKLNGKISNELLKNTMKNRGWGFSHKEETFVDRFECLVCERVAENYRRELKGLPKQQHQVTFEHYGCPKPEPPHILELELCKNAKYEAIALDNLIGRGFNFSSIEFYQEVIRSLLLEISDV